MNKELKEKEQLIINKMRNSVIPEDLGLLRLKLKDSKLGMQLKLDDCKVRISKSISEGDQESYFRAIFESSQIESKLKEIERSLDFISYLFSR